MASQSHAKTNIGIFLSFMNNISHLQLGLQTRSGVYTDVYRVSPYVSGWWVHWPASVLSSAGPPRGASRTRPVQAQSQRVELGRPRHVLHLSSVLQLHLCLKLRLFFGFLVALLQVLHQDSNDYIDQDELSGEDKGDKVDGGDHGVVAGASVLGAVP